MSGGGPSKRRRAAPADAIGLLLTILSAALLYLALTTEILSLRIDFAGAVSSVTDPVIARPDSSLLLELGADEAALARTERYTVLGGVRTLFDLQSYVAAVTVLLFSVLFPIAKVVILGWLTSFRRRAPVLEAASKELHRWALLDVFFIAVLVFSLGALDYVDAAIGVGFQWYLGYFMSSYAIILYRERLQHRLAPRPAAAAPYGDLTNPAKAEIEAS